MKRFLISAAVRTGLFVRKEDGAVTVDWVVLTAAVCGLAIIVSTILTEAVFETAAVAIVADVETATAR